jgi:hypothetical protein
VRWQAKRDTAFALAKPTMNRGLPVRTKAPSPLRFAGAVHEVIGIVRQNAMTRNVWRNLFPFSRRTFVFFTPSRLIFNFAKA